MIQGKSIVFLAAFVAVGGVSSPAQVVVRSGSILSCHPGTDCTEETVDGRRFYVMQTPQMVVKVAIEPDAKYSHVTVALENRGGFDIRVAPSDFRIEMTDPKFKRLSYLEPEKLKLPRVKAAKVQKTAAPAASLMGAVRESESSAPKFLQSATLAPAATASGEVYFERAGGSGTMSLLLPIAGSIFEFPYAPLK
jgi:hypothetical protein